MQFGAVIGLATSTSKHASLAGWRLLVVQPLDQRRQADGSPVIAVDNLGSGRGDHVILTSDGPAVREMLGADNSPARWAVVGLVDERR